MAEKTQTTRRVRLSKEERIAKLMSQLLSTVGSIPLEHENFDHWRDVRSKLLTVRDMIEKMPPQFGSGSGGALDNMGTMADDEDESETHPF